MDALGIRNVADDFALIGIHDDHVGRASDEQAMRSQVHFEIVPAARAAAGLGAVRTWAGASMESKRRVKVAQAIFFDTEAY